MGLIKELFDGTLLPAENFGYSDNPKLKKIHNEIIEIDKRFLDGLNDEQRNIYFQIKELRAEAESLEQDRMFSYAFRLGSRLIIDIYFQG